MTDSQTATAFANDIGASVRNMQQQSQRALPTRYRRSMFHRQTAELVFNVPQTNSGAVPCLFGQEARSTWLTNSDYFRPRNRLPSRPSRYEAPVVRYPSGDSLRYPIDTPTTSTSVEARSTWLCMLLIGDIVCLERDGEFLLGSILKR